MICHQYERTSVQILVELLQSKYDGQRILVDLTVVSFCSSVGNWTLTSIRIAMNQDCSNSYVERITSQYQRFVWFEVYQNWIRGQYILQLFKCCLFLIFSLPRCCLLCQSVERLCHAGQVRDELPVELYWAQERLQAWDVHRRWHLQNCLDLGSYGVVVVVGWLLNAPATCGCISGTDLQRQFYVLPHWDRSCRSNFPPHPVTVYWHRADQSQRCPYNARRLAG